MRKLSLLLALAVLPAACGGGSSWISIQNTRPFTGNVCPDGVCQDDADCSAAVYTGWIETVGHSKMTLDWELTDADDSVTAVTISCKSAQRDNGANGTGNDLCARASMDVNGTSTMVCPHTWSYANAEADQPTTIIDNVNAHYVNCVFTCTGAPTSADTLDIDVMLRAP